MGKSSFYTYQPYNKNSIQQLFTVKQVSELVSLFKTDKCSPQNYDKSHIAETCTYETETFIIMSRFTKYTASEENHSHEKITQRVFKQDDYIVHAVDLQLSENLALYLPPKHSFSNDSSVISNSSTTVSLKRYHLPLLGLLI